jgi:hypothetical protein
VATANASPARSTRWFGELLVVVALVPFALLGLAAALIPILLVTLVSRLPIAPAVRATAVPGIALLTFGGEWALFSWQSLRDDGWDFGLAAVLLFPFFVAALFLVQERVVLLWRRWRSRKRPRSGELPVLVGLRAAVAEQGWGAL